MSKFPEKSCQNCNHCKSWSFSGSFYEPPDAGWDCEQEGDKTIDRLIELHDLKAATWCKKYDEKMINSCPVCKKKIDQPEHTWKIWGASLPDNFAVCSEECKQEANKKYKQEVEQELRYFDDINN